MDIEQRNGRGVREGNENPVIQIFNYGTQATLDSVMYDRLVKKQRFIDQMLTGDIEADIQNGEQALEAAKKRAEFIGRLVPELELNSFEVDGKELTRKKFRSWLADKFDDHFEKIAPTYEKGITWKKFQDRGEGLRDTINLRFKINGMDASLDLEPALDWPWERKASTKGKFGGIVGTLAVDYKGEAIIRAHVLAAAETLGARGMILNNARRRLDDYRNNRLNYLQRLNIATQGHVKLLFEHIEPDVVQFKAGYGEVDPEVISGAYSSTGTISISEHFGDRWTLVHELEIHRCHGGNRRAFEHPAVQDLHAHSKRGYRG